MKITQAEVDEILIRLGYKKPQPLRLGDLGDWEIQILERCLRKTWWTLGGHYMDICGRRSASRIEAITLSLSANCLETFGYRGQRIQLHTFRAVCKRFRQLSHLDKTKIGLRAFKAQKYRRDRVGPVT